MKRISPMLKKSNLLCILSTLGIIFSSASTLAAANAPLANDTINIGLSVPRLKPGFELSVTSLFLRAGASNLNYAIYNKALPLLQPSWTEEELNPSFDPAFALEMSYAFRHAAGKDIDVGWTHFESDTTSASITAASASDFVGPDYDIGPDGSNIRTASGAAKFKADLVNVDFGQHLDFGQHFDVRFFGGLNTGFLKENLTDTYSGTATSVAAKGSIPLTTPGPFSVTQYENSRFSGAGPRFGFNADYNMQCGFGFLSEGAASLLMGTEDSNTSYLGTSQTLIAQGYSVPNAQYIADKHVFGVVPGFDTQLGFDYRHTFEDTKILTIALGYQAAIYLNAISQYLPGTLVDTKGLSTGSVYVVSMNHVLSNYSLQGPFLKLSLHF